MDTSADLTRGVTDPFKIASVSPQRSFECSSPRARHQSNGYFFHTDLAFQAGTFHWFPY